jgi:hypothetical protein
MNFGAFSEGLSILGKYLDEDDYCTSAAHDEFWCGPVEKGEMSEKDCRRLEELGWAFEDGMGWHAFT